MTDPTHNRRPADGAIAFDDAAMVARCRKGDIQAFGSLMAKYQDRFASPYVAAERGYIDDVIDPRETRWRVIRALEMLQRKTDSTPRKKHGNVPL